MVGTGGTGDVGHRTGVEVGLGDAIAGRAGGEVTRGQRGDRATLVGGLVVGNRQAIDGEVAGVGDQEAVVDDLPDGAVAHRRRGLDQAQRWVRVERAGADATGVVAAVWITHRRGHGGAVLQVSGRAAGDGRGGRVVGCDRVVLVGRDRSGVGEQGQVAEAAIDAGGDGDRGAGAVGQGAELTGDRRGPGAAAALAGVGGDQRQARRQRVRDDDVAGTAAAIVGGGDGEDDAVALVGGGEVHGLGNGDIGVQHLDAGGGVDRIGLGRVDRGRVAVLAEWRLDVDVGRIGDGDGAAGGHLAGAPLGRAAAAGRRGRAGAGGTAAGADAAAGEAEAGGEAVGDDDAGRGGAACVIDGDRVVGLGAGVDGLRRGDLGDAELDLLRNEHDGGGAPILILPGRENGRTGRPSGRLVTVGNAKRNVAILVDYDALNGACR